MAIRNSLTLSDADNMYSRIYNNAWIAKSNSVKDRCVHGLEISILVFSFSVQKMEGGTNALMPSPFQKS
jgi:hypothetical protein